MKELSYRWESVCYNKTGNEMIIKRKEDFMCAEARIQRQNPLTFIAFNPFSYCIPIFMRTRFSHLYLVLFACVDETKIELYL